jgi:hypothetical protein
MDDVHKYELFCQLIVKLHLSEEDLIGIRNKRLGHMKVFKYWTPIFSVENLHDKNQTKAAVNPENRGGQHAIDVWV